MFGRILGVVAIGVIAVLALDYFFLRQRGGNRRNILWEIAPVIGFIGAILLGLAFIEALRREVMDAWRWGVGLGLALAFISAVIWWARAGAQRGTRVTGWRAWLRLAQTYGIVVLGGVLGVVLAVRVIGALLEVFIASAVGVLALALALGIFIITWRSSVNSRQ